MYLREGWLERTLNYSRKLICERLEKLQGIGIHYGEVMLKRTMNYSIKSIYECFEKLQENMIYLGEGRLERILIAQKSQLTNILRSCTKENFGL